MGEGAGAARALIAPKAVVYQHISQYNSRATVSVVIMDPHTRSRQSVVEARTLSVAVGSRSIRLKVVAFDEELVDEAQRRWHVQELLQDLVLSVLNVLRR